MHRHLWQWLPRLVKAATDGLILFSFLKATGSFGLLLLRLTPGFRRWIRRRLERTVQVLRMIMAWLGSLAIPVRVRA